MNQSIYDELKKVAKKQSYVIYTDIAPLANLDMDSPADRDEIGRLLGEISEAEHAAGAPMLSAVVIQKDNNIPGRGFFTLAKQLGVYDGSDDFKFFVSELTRVYQYWSAATD